MKKVKSWVCYGCGNINKKGYFCLICGFSESKSRLLAKKEKYASNKERVI